MGRPARTGPPDRINAVVNPASGDGDGIRLYREFADALPGASHDAYVTVRPGEVAEAAREQTADADLLALVGGDGTLREATSALVEMDDAPPIFLVPAGRGNSSYRHLYGDTDWRAVAQALADRWTASPLDVGLVTTDPATEKRDFVLGFSAGLFRSTIVAAGRLGLLPGRLAYVLGTAWATLGDDSLTATLRVDGEQVYSGAGRLFAIGGGRYRGGEFALFPESRPADGRLHAVVVEPVGLGGAVELVRRARAGELHSHPAVHYVTGTSVTLAAQDRLPVEIDGTAVETQVAGAEIELVSDSLHYATPTQ